MIQKKELNPNIHENKKKKRGKNKKHLLTSMTSHIVDKNKDAHEDEKEADPEDGYEGLEEI